MPYMESCFQTLTGIRLKGLSQFMGWIKPGSYYHGVVARKGQLHMCLHLAGTEPSIGLQICPSQTWAVTQKEKETPTTSLHMPGKEGSVTQGARSYSPTPMETGGAWDGQSWVEQAEASAVKEGRRGRPAKHCQSASRRWEGWSTNPFPLPLQATKDLLPPIEEYLADDSFQGARDLRVVEKAKTLWVAVWLHHLDMAVAEDETASLSLDVTWHGRGPLLEFLLALMTSSLTFEEVVQLVLAENRYKVESSLDNIQKLRARLQRELKDLSQAHRGKPDKSSQKRIKRDMEQKWKDIKGLGVTISQYESSLRRARVQPEETPVSEVCLTPGPRVLKRQRWLLSR